MEYIEFSNKYLSKMKDRFRMVDLKTATQADVDLACEEVEEIITSFKKSKEKDWVGENSRFYKYRLKDLEQERETFKWMFDREKQRQRDAIKAANRRFKYVPIQRDDYPKLFEHMDGFVRPGLHDRAIDDFHRVRQILEEGDEYEVYLYMDYFIGEYNLKCVDNLDEWTVEFMADCDGCSTPEDVDEIYDADYEQEDNMLIKGFLAVESDKKADYFFKHLNWGDTLISFQIPSKPGLFYICDTKMNL